MEKEKKALICMMFYGEMKGTREIAKELGLSVNTITRNVNSILFFRNVNDENSEVVTRQSKINDNNIGNM